jgi:hypothetical protein
MRFNNNLRARKIVALLLAVIMLLPSGLGVTMADEGLQGETQTTNFDSTGQGEGYLESEANDSEPDENLQIDETGGVSSDDAAITDGANSDDADLADNTSTDDAT